MVLQFWVPFVFCSALAIAIKLVLPRHIRSHIWRVGAAIGAGISFILVLGFNRTQVIYTRAETKFFNELTTVVAHDRAAKISFPHVYFVRMDTVTPYFIGANIENAYARTIFAPDVRFRCTPPYPIPYEGPVTVFQKNGVIIGAEPLISYRQVTVLAWNGRTLVEVPVVNNTVAKELRATWTGGTAAINVREIGRHL